MPETLIMGTMPVMTAYYQPAWYGASPPAAATTTTAQPASPTASASDLQVLIASIPTAHDGQVITADYHNALRLALVAIANRMGLGPVSEEITVTVAPRFASAAGIAASSAWALDYGVATSGTATAGAVKGWVEIDLPDGARIKKMVAFATKTGSGTLTIRLVRQKVTDATEAPVLAQIAVPVNADLTKGVEANVTLPGIGAGVTAIEEFRMVDTRQNKYLITAEIDNVTGTTAKITGVQIVLGR